MDAYGIQQKIYYGYYKAAFKLGASFNLYRSATPINPISSGNLIGQTVASTNVSWEYMKANKYGNAVWQIMIDARNSSSPLNAKVGDYLVPIASPEGPITDDSIYFMASLQYLLPMQAVKCNRTLTVIRPTQSTSAGYIGYAGYTKTGSTLIMENMPASVLELNKDGAAPTKLPTDVNQPQWIILLPNLGNVTLRVDDIITDDLNQDYVVNVNELTELGWRIIATQVLNAR